MRREHAFLAVMVALIPAAIWLFFFAPCSWLWWSSTKDLPVRCLSTYTRGVP